MIITAADIERAVRRHWWRHPQHDQTPIARLPLDVQERIYKEAIEIYSEATCTIREDKASSNAARS